MVYTLTYESEILMKNPFFKLRNLMNPETDVIHIAIVHSHLSDENNTAIYKKALKLEGQYRTQHNAWLEPAARVRVVSQL